MWWAAGRTFDTPALVAVLFQVHPNVKDTWEYVLSLKSMDLLSSAVKKAETQGFEIELWLQPDLNKLHEWSIKS